MSNLLPRAFLVVAGFTAVTIGCVIAFAPHLFYAGYGIQLGDNPDLLSELRAPGANLAVLGALMLTGALRVAMFRPAMVVTAIVFLAYAAGRVIGLVLDGVPSDAIMAAMAIELVIGGISAVLLARGYAQQDIRRSSCSVTG